MECGTVSLKKFDCVTVCLFHTCYLIRVFRLNNSDKVSTMLGNWSNPLPDRCASTDPSLDIALTLADTNHTPHVHHIFSFFASELLSYAYVTYQLFLSRTSYESHYVHYTCIYGIYNVSCSYNEVNNKKNKETSSQVPCLYLLYICLKY